MINDIDNISINLSRLGVAHNVGTKVKKKKNDMAKFNSNNCLNILL